MIAQALNDLGVDDWRIEGVDPTNELEFNALFVKTVNGEDVRDPAQFGVTWAQVQAAIAAIEIGNIPIYAKAEAGRRIVLVLKDDATQRNMTALATGLVRKENAATITATELAALNILDAARDWVTLMQQTGRGLANNVDPTYADDSHWPAAPAGLDALIAQL